MKKETTDGQTLEAGTRIYYTGDAANLDREGTVSRIFEDRWGSHVEIVLDEIEAGAETVPERKTTISPLMFEPGPGRRFLTVAKRDEERDAKIAALREAYERRTR